MEREKTKYRESSWVAVRVPHFREEGGLRLVVAVGQMEVDTWMKKLLQDTEAKDLANVTGFWKDRAS